MNQNIVKPVQLLFIDIETDGLNVENNQILEISCILTDNKLNQIGEPFHSLILPRGDYEWIYENMPPTVQEMHTKNGLLAEIKIMIDNYYNRPKDITSLDSRFLFKKRVETKILDWLNDLWKENEPVPEIRMAGHSINSLDKPFIEHHMPELASILSHRTHDISSYVRFFTDSCEIPNDKVPFGIKVSGHRAQDDNFMALNEARKLRKWIIENISKQKENQMYENDILIAESHEMFEENLICLKNVKFKQTPRTINLGLDNKTFNNIWLTADLKTNQLHIDHLNKDNEIVLWRHTVTLI